MKRTALFVALAALVSTASNSAEIRDLSAAYRSMGSQPKTLRSVTGLNNENLYRTTHHKGEFSNVQRFVQIFEGVPLYRTFIVAEGKGNIAEDGVYIDRAYGNSVLNVELGLPAGGPLVGWNDANEIARLFLTKESPLQSDANLYIDTNESGVLNYIYLADVYSASGIRHTVMVDGTSGKVLDNWDEGDTVEGGRLDFAKANLKKLGWSPRDIEALHEHSKIYWTEGAKISESGCGAIQAAKALGYNSEDVVVAFAGDGVCRSGRRFGKISFAPIESDPAENAALPTQKSTLSPTYSPWSRFTSVQAKSLPMYNTPHQMWSRLQTLENAPWHRDNSNIWVNQWFAKIEDSEIRTNSENRCGSRLVQERAEGASCVDIRFQNSREKIVTPRRSSTHGNTIMKENTHDSRPIIYRQGGFNIEFSNMNMVEVSTVDTHTVGVGVSFSYMFGAPDVAQASGSVSIQYEYGREKGKTTAVEDGETQSLQSPLVFIASGCKVVWSPTKTYTVTTIKHTSKPEFRGIMYAKGKRNGSTSWSEYWINAREFYSPINLTNAKFDITEKHNIERSVGETWAPTTNPNYTGPRRTAEWCKARSIPTGAQCQQWLGGGC